MNFDQEGHLIATPEEIDRLARAGEFSKLINEVLLIGTPAAFATYRGFRDFVDGVADGLAVHPSCIVFRGSTKLGFSIAPRSDKLWVEMGPDSDIDLAIVDPDHFHFLDAEVRRWERRATSFHGQSFTKRMKLRANRAFYCYRYMDLPDTALVQKYQAAMDRASAPSPPGCNRPVTAFFYRDWWSVFSRYESDLRQLVRGLRSDLSAGPKTPKPRPIQ